MRIFIDTSAFYTLLERDDENHRKAKNVWADLLKNENTLITSNYILVETFALLQHRLGIEAVRGFQNDIIPLINIEFVISELHRLASVPFFLRRGETSALLIALVSR
jgi:predicted nucleic acid-binding protein